MEFLGEFLKYFMIYIYIYIYELYLRPFRDFKFLDEISFKKCVCIFE